MNPTERATRARIAALTMHSKHDSRETSAPGRVAAFARFERQVDPDGALPPAERQRRAEAAQRAHMAGLALRSARARRRRG